jgi:hypothetical protein
MLGNILETHQHRFFFIKWQFFKLIFFSFSQNFVKLHMFFVSDVGFFFNSVSSNFIIYLFKKNSKTCVNTGFFWNDVGFGKKNTEKNN